MNLATHQELLDDPGLRRIQEADLSWFCPWSEKDPEPGAIWMVPGTTRAMINVIFWGDSGDKKWLVIPISNYPAPLTPSEVVSPVPSPFDGALEISNGRSMKIDELEKRFIYLLHDGPKPLSEHQMERLKKCYISDATGTRFPDNFEKSRGPLPGDVGHQHREQEKKFWRRVLI